MFSRVVFVPDFEPMPLASLHAPFDHPDWIFELKYDGFRALAYIDSGQCRLVSRQGTAYKSFSHLCAAIGSVIPRQTVLDGEIVHLGSDGKPLFYDLMRRRSPVAQVWDEIHSIKWPCGEVIRIGSQHSAIN